ncbi:GNAT family acetyltransferase [Stutzerimonas stutzeri]|uniref:GNAT family acetyltransferase n=2 Tax=Stutzerimonas stutzeri TaxID=316 RepID=W8QXQ8_STUST|nr:GNAT family N-acetyltransferase [Stutzerimonas stutzeri]AHL75425.1 GNAT family acetyltransferase [Stutzerimonas stutzeri]MCQ4328012.1 GNAT family N-acetyltransferase [Stutzerimonas stutzeri]
MAIEIRAADEEDAGGISEVIVAALRTTNAKDYSQAVIEQVETSFSPSAVAVLIGKRMVFVALEGNTVIGTASLDGQVVRTVFVRPQSHGQGIGSLLMNTVEQTARRLGIETLSVPSSVTAELFYKRLGYSAVRETFHGEERTIVMERYLMSSDLA